MAQYKQSAIAQLMLTQIPTHIALERFTYRLTVKSSEANKPFDSGIKSFDKLKRTIQVYIAHDTAIVNVDIYLDGKVYRKDITLSHFNEKERNLNTIKLESQIANNSSKENHIVRVDVEQGAELGWILIKKKQTFDSLLRWVYKKVTSHSERDIFRHANEHLSDLQDLNLNNFVNPGQIVLITNKKYFPKLSEYKRLVLEAEKIYQILCKDKNFDPEFFANNYELLMDFYNVATYAAKARLEYKKTVEGHKEDYCKPLSVNIPYEATNAATIYSDKTDKMFYEAETKRVQTKLVNELKINLENIQKAHALEVKNKTSLANNKHYDQFRKANYIYYQKIETLLSKDLTTLHNNKEYAKILKDIVKDTSGVRATDFQGGLKLSVARMHAIGNATISLKAGSKIIFYLSAAESVGNIYTASETGNAEYTFKVTVVESMSLGGGAAAGAIGASGGTLVGGKIGIVLAPFTGGLSIPVLSVVGAVIGGVGGGISGTFLFNKVAKEITNICD